MPTGTFFRLPEEKRARLTEAAWREFERTRFSDTSINRIIQDADIPRGSFYQYFADKEELFAYLVSDIKSYFMEMCIRAIEAVEGDVFALPPYILDHVLRPDGGIDPMVERCARVMRINPGMDFDQLLPQRAEVQGEFHAALLQRADLSALRRGDGYFVDRLLELLIHLTGAAVAEVLSGLDSREDVRGALMMDIDIIKYGSLSMDGRAGSLAGRITQ
jgi:AcrR family transcriptional regulator